MKFSIRLNNDLPISAYPRLAQAAESVGFDQFWVSDDLFLRGVWPILSACAVATERIELGTTIVNPYTLHPAEMAMQAASLDEMSNGRFNLGIAAGAGDFLEWVGLSQARPYTLISETLSVVRALFAGERVPFDGRELTGWTDKAYLRFPSRQIPLYIGAMSPRMLGLIGSAADGGLPLLFPPESYGEVLECIRAGANQAGRDIDEIDVLACVWVSVAEDSELATDALREKIAYYGHALSETILDRLGLKREDFSMIEHAIQVERNVEQAKSLVTDRMLRIGIAGNGHEVIERLEGLVDMGANHLSCGPPIGPDPMEAICVLGREVIPHFRRA